MRAVKLDLLITKIQEKANNQH